MRHAAAGTSRVLYSFSAMTHSPFLNVAQCERVKGFWRACDSRRRESPVNEWPLRIEDAILKIYELSVVGSL